MDATWSGFRDFLGHPTTMIYVFFELYLEFYAFLRKDRPSSGQSYSVERSVALSRNQSATDGGKGRCYPIGN